MPKREKPEPSATAKAAAQSTTALIAQLWDMGAIPQNHVPYIGDPAARKMDLAKGYIPVVGSDGEHAHTAGGSPVYSRPR